MNSRTYISPASWNGKDLTGEWLFTVKLDGVRLFKSKQGAVSRSGKPLYGADDLKPGDYEIFAGSWEKSITAVRTKNAPAVPEDCVYSLDPPDPRIDLWTAVDPSADYINDVMRAVLKQGHEGLVLRQGSKWLKVKPVETLDLEVTGVVPGKGRNLGKMGALITSKGKIGQGFKDKDREESWNVGDIIEVAFRTLTPAGLIKEGRFVRRRVDK